MRQQRANICCNDFNERSWNIPCIALITHHSITMSLDYSRKHLMGDDSRKIMVSESTLKNRSRTNLGSFSLKVFTISWTAKMPVLTFTSTMSSHYHTLFCINNTLIPVKHLSNLQRCYFHLRDPYKLENFCKMYTKHLLYLQSIYYMNFI